MPRDMRGRAVKSGKRDRLKTEASRAGIAHKADDMKSEDQGGKDGKPKAGHVTEKKGAESINYARKRH